MAGRYRDRSLSRRDRRYRVKSSTSLGFTELMPAMVLAAITGKTMRKAVKRGVRSVPRIRKAMRITAITGVAETTVKRGLKKAPTRLSSPPDMPTAIPRGTERAIPPVTRRKVLIRENKKRSFCKRVKNRRNTGRGPGKIRGLPKIREPPSQSKRRAAIPAKNQGREKFAPFFSFKIEALHYLR
jgi:hypothetical protein